MKRTKWFTDEGTDLSNKELLSLVLRYVDHDTGMAREDVMGFLEGISGRCLADKITTTLQNYGLDLTKLRGQAYDGAGNMAGSIAVVVSPLKERPGCSLY